MRRESRKLAIARMIDASLRMIEEYKKKKVQKS